MTQTVLATLENGALIPDQPLALPTGSRVRLVVEPLEADMTNSAADQEWEEWEELCDKTKLDAAASRLTRDQLHERR